MSTNLMFVCTSLTSSFAQAEDYVTKSQINATNGVSGLNKDKEVTANIRITNVNTTSINTNTLRGNILNINTSPTLQDIYPIRFNTSGEYGIDLFYNFTARTDDWKNSLNTNCSILQ